MGTLILAYDNIDYSTATTPEDFEENLKTLKEAGFKPVRLSEISEAIENKTPLSNKTVHITFDGGFAGVYLYALPILEKYKFFATVFVVASKIANSIKRATFNELVGLNIAEQAKELLAKSLHVSWEELKTMVNSGVFEVGSNSLNKKACFCCPKLEKFNDGTDEKLLLELLGDKRLGIPIFKRKWDCACFCMLDDKNLRDHMAEFVKNNGGILFFKKDSAQKLLLKEFKRFTKQNKPIFTYEPQQTKNERMQMEIEQSKRVIEEKLKIPVDFFAYPWGNYDVDVVYQTMKSGYKAALTLDIGLAEHTSFPYLLPRVKVKGVNWLKKRLKIYSSPTRAKIYSKVHGLL